MARREKNYPPEFKARAIELCLKAITFGWSVARFAKWAKIPRVTVLTWLQDDLVFDRYKRAMEQKALDFPTMHADLIKRVIEGEIVKDPETGERRRVYMDPKRARVAMQGLEFRMMREIKRIYQPTAQIDHKHSLDEMSDAEIEKRRDELIERAIAKRVAKSPDEDSPGPTIN